MGQRVQNPDACGIAEELEELGQGLDRLAAQQLRPHLGKRGGVARMRFRAEVGVLGPGADCEFGDGHDY